MIFLFGISRCIAVKGTRDSLSQRASKPRATLLLRVMFPMVCVFEDLGHCLGILVRFADFRHPKKSVILADRWRWRKQSSRISCEGRAKREARVASEDKLEG